jgi:hypothetical protein
LLFAIATKARTLSPFSISYIMIWYVPPSILHRCCNWRIDMLSGIPNSNLTADCYRSFSLPPLLTSLYECGPGSCQSCHPITSHCWGLKMPLCRAWRFTEPIRCLCNKCRIVFSSCSILPLFHFISCTRTVTNKLI